MIHHIYIYIYTYIYYILLMIAVNDTVINSLRAPLSKKVFLIKKNDLKRTTTLLFSNY